MKKLLAGFIIILAGLAFSADKIIPVAAWPKVLNQSGKQIFNPTEGQCLTAGYRLLAAKPATPAGKVIASEKIIQDPTDPAKCIYDITYTDKPVIQPPPPEVLTNVAADKVHFTFTTAGVFRAVVWTDAPKTNGVKE